MLDKEYVIEKPFSDENGNQFLVKVSNNIDNNTKYYIVDLHDVDSKELLETFTLEEKSTGSWVEKEGNETTAAKTYGMFINENI